MSATNRRSGEETASSATAMAAAVAAAATAMTAEELVAAAEGPAETAAVVRHLIGSTDVKEFYGNDIVFSYEKKKGLVFGVVVDSYESSGSEDSMGALEKGQIRVYWPHNHSEHIWKQENVHLFSRFILPGDIVRRLEDGKETQRGYCRSSRQVATVQILGTDKVIENVSQDRLDNILKFNYGTAVCLNNRFGRIMNFDQKVSLTSKCGSVVEILNSINHDIEEYWLGRRGSAFVGEYYVGQDVALVPWNLEEPTWIKKSKTLRRNLHVRQKFTVKSVEIVNVDVAWHKPDVTFTDESKLHMSIADVKIEEIHKLQLMESMEERSLELCERRLLKLSPGDTMITKKQWLYKRSKQLIPHLTKAPTTTTASSKKKKPRHTSNSLLNTDDEIYVMGADDVEEEEEEDMDAAADDGGSDEAEWSTDNESSIADDKQRMLVVFKKKRCGMKKVTLERILNVPVEVTCYDSQVTIVWQDGTEEKDLSSTQLYYSISLDDHEFFPGEWVVRNEDTFTAQFGVVQKVDYLERTAMIKWFEYIEKDKEQKYLRTDEMSVYDITKHPKFAFRPGIFVYSRHAVNGKLGMVHDSCPQGYIVVKWSSGEVGNYTPHELVLLPDTHDLLDDDEEDENESGQLSWETESIESITGDMNSEPILQNMAARLDFVRSRIVYLREAFQQHTVYENFTYLRDLLIVYDNSSYLDKLLGTSFFNNKSKHYQTLLQQVKDRARLHGVEIFGRCVSDNNTALKMKAAERENINKVLRLEHKINAQIESAKESSTNKEGGEPSLAPTPDSEKISITSDNLCVEVLSMIKARMDLAYAEIIARMDGTQALTVMTKASAATVTPMLSMPSTPDDSLINLTPPKLTSAAKPNVCESYSVLDDAPNNHRYFNSKNEPTDKMQFFRAVRTESNLLRESLPPGVWVRSYANRMDLLSVMIRGPGKTPYEDGLFLFDMQLSADYPRSPPLVSYISYSSERLNPNLYVEGRVCVSLLGTWLGRGTEVWGPNSTLLQLIVSIQGLILVAEPYYNEAGYEKQSESQQGYENSRTYNELVILKLVQSMTELLLSPPQVFRKEVFYHFSDCGERLCVRLKALINNTSPETMKLDFPLLPISKGLKLSLNTALDRFHQVLTSTLEKQQQLLQQQQQQQQKAIAPTPTS